MQALWCALIAPLGRHVTREFACPFGETIAAFRKTVRQGSSVVMVSASQAPSSAPMMLSVVATCAAVDSGAALKDLASFMRTVKPLNDAVIGSASSAQHLNMVSSLSGVIFPHLTST